MSYEKFWELMEMCDECMSEHCAFNPKGICLFPLLYERYPDLCYDGCDDYTYYEREAV